MDKLVFNGINGATGGYLWPEMTVEEVAETSLRELFVNEHLEELRYRHHNARIDHLGTKYGVRAEDLAQAGWGVIFAKADNDEVSKIKEALEPLLNWRRELAGDLYKEYVDSRAYRSGESKGDFLARFGKGPGSVDPKIVPYYLLIVASPEVIPFSFQTQLDVLYAVGRIHFDTLEEYANYANSVVWAEKGELKRARRAAFFGVRNPGDKATCLSAGELVEPLADWMTENYDGWDVQTILKDDAHKAGLTYLFEEKNGPAFLFTASHGMGFPKDDSRQLRHQGALLCQDWPGPYLWVGKPIPEDYYFSVDDVSTTAELGGMISFHFACYGAGTPQKDDFVHSALQEEGSDIAPRPFISQLPQRLLSHPRGGVLAVIGHVERAWGYSFIWEKAGAQRTIFESMISQLVDGHPIGLAFECFNERYAELSTDLTEMLRNRRFARSNGQKLAQMWIANNDAGGYIIIGDPAVRLAV